MDDIDNQQAYEKPALKPKHFSKADPSSEKTWREFTRALQTTIQQVKLIQTSLPKIAFRRQLRGCILALFIGLILGIALPHYLPKFGFKGIAGGIGMAPEAGIMVFAWGDDSKEFLDCLHKPAVNKVCSLRINQG